MKLHVPRPPWRKASCSAHFDCCVATVSPAHFCSKRRPRKPTTAHYSLHKSRIVLVNAGSRKTILQTLQLFRFGSMDEQIGDENALTTSENHSPHNLGCEKQNDDERESSGNVESHKEIVELVSGDQCLTQEQAQTKPLSKNAQKKLKKMERYKAQKLEKKAQEKSRRHQETERKRNEWEAKLASVCEAEQEQLLKGKTEKRLARREKWTERKDRLKRAMESGQNFVLDLEFCDRMRPNELVSLVQQVMYSYAANAKAVVPVRFSLTGCRGEILYQLSRVSGFSNWHVHKEELSYLEVFKERKGDLVYLTADADTLIDQLEDSKIYIVGGLVDRNRWKSLTLEKARSQGIATAKLPITQYLKMTSSPVLTVNQVVELMLSFLELKDWESALLRVIPLRKRSAEDNHNEEDQARTKVLAGGLDDSVYDGSMHHLCKTEIDQTDMKCNLLDKL